MTHKLSYLLPLIVILASCQREQEWGGAPDIKAKVESEQKTRTSLSVDESGSGTIYWNPSDKIDVFFGTKKTQYTSQNASDAIAATFKTSDSVSGTDVSSTNIWGLYPSNSSSSCNGSSITTTLPSTQYGVPNTFDKDIFPAVARSSSTDLQFYNVCGGIKFNLAYDDIKKITFRGNNNENLAGTVSISFVDNLQKATVVNGVKEITLTPKTGTTFTKGADYYFILLPVTLSAGFTITFTATDGTTGTLNYTDNPVTIKRSIFGKKGNMDVYAAFADERQPNNVIYYTSIDGQVITPTNSNVFGANILSNEYVGGRGIIAFEGSVLEIGENAFCFCDLTSIKIPNSVTIIGRDAFRYCSELVSIEIPNSVKSIGHYAFAGCTDLTSIEIPSSVESIGSCVFYACTGLTSLEIPDSVTSIGINLFAYCNSLATVRVDNSNSSFDSRNNCNAIINTATNELVSGCTNSVIPNSVTSIGDYAFEGFTGLESIEIPNSVIRIGSSAFQNCGLTSIEIPNSVTDIGDNPFRGCHELASIFVKNGNPGFDSRNDCNAVINSNTNELVSGCMNSVIPNSVTSIGLAAFGGSIGLTSIEIPNSVTSFGHDAFSYCRGLTSIKVNALSPPTIGARVFYDTNNCPIYVPAESVNAYKTADGWSEYADRIQAMPSQNNVIYYTSTDGQVVTPNMSDVFGANIVSNEYVGGKGVITFDGDVTSIGDNAFSFCYQLTSIAIPNSVTSIGNNAFDSCSLTSITIPNSVTSINDYAFARCHGFSTVSIPNSVISLGAGVFSYCVGLTSITIPNSVTSIGDNPFCGCDGLTSIVVESGNPVYDSRNGCNAIIKTDINELISGCKDTILPNSVTSIGNHAFYCCGPLTSITIPNSVTNIGDYAFQDCHGLTSIAIPSSVTSIGTNPFSVCHGLTSIVVESGNSTYDSRNNCNAIIKTNTDELISGCKNTSISDSVKSIGSDAFSGCSGLTSITIPNSVTDIGPFAFSGCSGLISITIPNSVINIGEYAFNSCSGLSSVAIPHSVTSIGSGAFIYCMGLNSITINGITPPSLGYAAFELTNYCPIFVHAESVDAYMTAWSEYADRIQAMPSQNNVIYYTSSDGQVVTPYKAGVFGANIISNEYKNGEGVITFEADVTAIGREAFRNCSRLTSIRIPDTVTSIGYSAFYSCSSLASVRIPDSVTSIGQYAFRYCRSLVSVDLPDSVITIEDRAFETCEGLTSLEIPNSVTSIGEGAFSYCSALTSIVIPSSVTSIGMNPFGACSGLASIVVESGNPSYDSRNNCNAIINTTSNYLITGCKNTVIPDTVTRINGWAFLGCSRLTTIEIPSSVSMIIHEAFLHCIGLTSITVYASTPPTLNDDTVFDDTNDCPIYVPAQSVDAYKSAWSVYADRIQAIVVHEAVDLGLSVKWATCNVGASAPEEYGDYFAWGETESKNDYDWSTYRWCNGSYNTLTKYNTKNNYGPVDNKVVLESSDDVAKVNWRGNWRMPTDAEFSELRNQCIWTWTVQNGVNGYKVTSMSNGNSIFMPASGGRAGTASAGLGSYGDYWSSTLDSPYPNNAWRVYFSSGSVNRNDDGRYVGRSVRPVSD